MSKFGVSLRIGTFCLLGSLALMPVATARPAETQTTLSMECAQLANVSDVRVTVSASDGEATAVLNSTLQSVTYEVTEYRPKIETVLVNGEPKTQVEVVPVKATRIGTVGFRDVVANGSCQSADLNAVYLIKFAPAADRHALSNPSGTLIVNRANDGSRLSVQWIPSGDSSERQDLECSVIN